MIIVSNTTPLHYLIQIDETRVLKDLFGRIIIPEAVHAEMQHEKTPPAVKDWIAAHPYLFPCSNNRVPASSKTRGIPIPSKTCTGSFLLVSVNKGYADLVDTSWVASSSPRLSKLLNSD